MHIRFAINSVYDLLGKGYFSFAFAFLTVLIMPVYVSYLPPFMILWGISCIAECLLFPAKHGNVNRELRFLFYLFIIYYVWQAVSLLYSDDIRMGFQNLFGRLSLVVLPLVVVYAGKMIKNKALVLIKTFAAATFIYILLSFGYALYRSLSLHNGIWLFDPHPAEFPWMSYFFGIYLTLDQHPSYISMYVLLSVFISFELWFNYSIEFRHRLKWLIIGIVLLASQYFLSSRAGIFISLILVPLYLIYKLRKYGRRKFSWVAVVLIVLVLLPVIVKNKRVDYLYGYVFNQQVDYERKQDPRIRIWESTLNLARQNLLLGVGIGDVRDELALEYRRVGEKEMASIRYNAHNQFLEVLLENGIFGFIVFISIFCYMAYIAFSQRNLLYGIFILMIFLFFLFETILYRLAGVTFFSLFSFLLIYLKPAMVENGMTIQKE